MNTSILENVERPHAISAVYWIMAGAVIFMTTMSSLQADDQFSQRSSATNQQTTDAQPTATPYTPKSKSQLRRELSSLQYYVTQEEGTEKAFRNLYWDNKDQGVYHCIVCDRPLFSSQTKYKSGTGWPSFYAPLTKDVLGLRNDWKLFYARTEVHCQRCNAHLGHVFDDGPRPTGKRYCMNSASLKFVEQRESKKSKAAQDPQSAKTDP